jgi:proteasome lid subunit RPN8/RPN11
MRATDDVLNAIRRHGAEAYPEEGCGFLLGEMNAGGVRATRVHRAGNERATERERRFTLSPAAYRTAEAAAEDAGLDVVGFYHSHPDAPARPSETDLTEAPFSGYAYVIVGVEDGQPAALTAWQLAPDRSRFVEDDITRDAAATPS